MQLPRSISLILALCVGAIAISSAAPTTNLPISALTNEVDSDQSVVYYGKRLNDSLLIGNDGGAATGGIRSFGFTQYKHNLTLTQTAHVRPGRTKAVGVLYDIDTRGKDVIVSIAAPDSFIRLFDVNGMREVPVQKKALGDWSCLCTWRNYFFLFGKKVAMQFLVRESRGDVEILEIQTFPLPVEPSSCAVADEDNIVYFAGENETIYSFTAADSTASPKIETIGQVTDEITGLAVYISDTDTHYILISQTDTIEFYTPDLQLKGSLSITGAEDIEISGLSIHQANSTQYPYGLLSFAIESDLGTGYGTASLEPAFQQLTLKPNTSYTPQKPHSPHPSPAQNGFTNPNGSLSCFAGFTGPQCKTHTCPNACSSRGSCTGPNECLCNPPWAGPDCSWIGVSATYETAANGGDGDDPAIWISPAKDKNKSTIITTTKSEIGAGLAVFDLRGNLLQTVSATEPNNVDVVYGVRVGERVVDLAFAACRGDDTLCFFEITPTGHLKPIRGGNQTTPEDFTVYGSCTYRSPKTGKQYVFVNEKSGRYLQYELHASSDSNSSSSSNGTALSTTLVRSFIGGSGGQPEGCVADEENGWLFLGEEALGVWRYDAEPGPEPDTNISANGTLIAKVGDSLYADVEGLSLLYGNTPEKGLLVVSCQGVSAFSVLRRAAPHEHVLTFTIGESEDGAVDGVTNTDGVAGVGTRLNGDFPAGLLVVHDDANQLQGVGTAELASFKLVSLGDVLGVGEVQGEVDTEWDPRLASYI